MALSHIKVGDERQRAIPKYLQTHVVPRALSPWEWPKVSEHKEGLRRLARDVEGPQSEAAGLLWFTHCSVLEYAGL